MEVAVALIKEIRNANLAAIIAAAAENQASAVTITAQITQAALRASAPALATLALATLAVSPLSVADQDPAIVAATFVAVAVDFTPEDGEEDLGLAHGATPGSTQEAVHPRSTHAPDPGKTAAEEEDFPSHAPRTSAAEKISPGQRTPRSRQSFTLTSLAPSPVTSPSASKRVHLHLPARNSKLASASQ